MGIQYRCTETYAAVIQYIGEEKYVLIPSSYEGLPVTQIDEKAFYHNSHVLQVTLPTTLEAIGASAFEGCWELKRISTQAMQTTEKTEDSLLPDTLCFVGDRAFWGSGLMHVQFTAPRLQLGESAFEACKQLKSAALAPHSMLIMGSRVFAESSIVDFTAEAVATYMLPDFAFYHCEKLRSVCVKTKRLGFHCFDGCMHLSELRLGNRLEHIDPGALNGCDKLNVKDILPKLPSSMGSTAEQIRIFAEAESLQQLLQIVESYQKQEATAQKVQRARKISLNQQQARTQGNESLDLSLFYLHPESELVQTANLPQKFCGAVAAETGVFYVVPEHDAKTSLPRLRCHLTGIGGVEQILAQIWKDSLTLGVQGYWQAEIFAVQELYPVFSNEYGQRDGSPTFFREVLARYNSPIPEAPIGNETGEPMALRYPEEMTLFLQMCRDCTPQWVNRAYQRNLTTAEGGRATGGGDEKKHAQRAMSLLVNIAWLPKRLELPSGASVSAMLDAAVYGLQEVKIRVLETLSQIRRTGKLPKWGILLAGPAGTGKTSIAKAIAQILSFPMIYLDFSSIGSEADTICGTSRIYGNARPGLILEQMYHNRSATAVLLANEIDKAGAGAVNTLLTVLDKIGFYENFLEEFIPTDNLFCVATCNNPQMVPAPLLDRFQIIEIPGYTYEEKRAIWRNYVLPMAMEQAAIGAGEMTVPREAEELLLREYAVEPGIRDLEKLAQRLVGNYCQMNETPNSGSYTYTPALIRELLGPERRQVQTFLAVPGMVQGVLMSGGEVQFFQMEATVTPGHGEFQILGNLNETQKSYCRAAYCCLRSSCNVDFSRLNVTVFLPTEVQTGCENQVGLACYAAIYSRLVGKNLASRSVCFFGGCALSGSIYLPAVNLSVLLRAMQNAGVTKLYAPLGTGRYLKPTLLQNYQVTVVEAPDAATLMRLALNHTGETE